MNIFFTLIFFTLFHQIDLIASDRIDEFQTQLKSEQIDFVSCNLDDTKAVTNIISRMYQLDQEVRQIFIQDRNNPEIIDFLTAMDQYHTKSMKDILAIHQWINISTFGPQADNQAWLLVQHADQDLQFQTQCLMVLQNLYQKNETNPKNYAYLYDRVALQSQELGMKQKYGTQYCISDSGKISLRPHDGTIEEINAQRKEVGLSLIEEYFEQIKHMYKNK